MDARAGDLDSKIWRRHGAAAQQFLSLRRLRHGQPVAALALRVSITAMRTSLCCCAFFVLVPGFTKPVEARVERVEILARSDVLNGKEFGEAGAYEKLVGKVHFAVNPEAAPNRLIVDLEKAPRSAAGEVEFVSDFYLLKPK